MKEQEEKKRRQAVSRATAQSNRWWYNPNLIEMLADHKPTNNNADVKRDKSTHLWHWKIKYLFSSSTCKCEFLKMFPLEWVFQKLHLQWPKMLVTCTQKLCLPKYLCMCMQYLSPVYWYSQRKINCISNTHPFYPLHIRRPSLSLRFLTA